MMPHQPLDPSGTPGANQPQDSSSPAAQITSLQINAHTSSAVPAVQPDDAFELAALPQRQREFVIAVGDNHGCDPQMLKDDLQSAGALDNAGRFNAAYSGFLVQIGDTVDRGAYSMEIFNFWRELQNQVPDRVVRLLGNHEMYHLIGAPGIIRAAPLPGLQQMLIDDILSGKITAAWTEADILYTHAGLDLDVFPEYSGESLTFIAEDLNRRLREAVMKMVPGDIYLNLRIIDAEPIFSAGPYGNGHGGGIFWARQPIENSEFRQVVGHTPQVNGIKAAPGLRVKYIDANRAKAENKPGQDGVNAREFMFNTQFSLPRPPGP